MPELYFHGVDAALKECEAGSIIYTFTDAPAKDSYLRYQVLIRAIKQNIYIHSFYVIPIYFGRRKRQASISDTEITQLDGSDKHDFATATGGFTIGIQKEDASAVAAYVLSRLQPMEVLLTISVSEPTNITFAVDKTIDLIKIDISATKPLSGSIKLIDPTGAEIIPQLVANSTFFQVYQLTNPTYGSWNILSLYSDNCTIQISGPSSVSCSTTLSEKVKRESLEDYASLLTPPLVNQSDLFLFTICQNLPTDIQNGSITLTSLAGSTISVLLPSKLARNGFITPIEIPNMNFRILTNIELMDNTQLQRQMTTVISPAAIGIEITNQPYTLVGNNTVNITYTISNRDDNALNITLCVTDTLQLFNESEGCVQTYFVNSMDNVTDQLTISNRFYEKGSNTTSSILTFSISAPTVTTGAADTTDSIQSYSDVTLLIESETTTSVPVITDNFSDVILLLPLCT